MIGIAQLQTCTASGASGNRYLRKSHRSLTQGGSKTFSMIHSTVLGQLSGLSWRHFWLIGTNVGKHMQACLAVGHFPRASQTYFVKFYTAIEHISVTTTFFGNSFQAGSIQRHKNTAWVWIASLRIKVALRAWIAGLNLLTFNAQMAK